MPLAPSLAASYNASVLSSQILAFRKTLLGWYQKNARDLPWRQTRNPYAIWVSEIMLQQTQVKTVIPYYEKWMKKFPTVAALAKAPQGEVLKHWAGLGYYRRARMLHQAAQTLVEKFGGKIPKSAKELQEIPGIGRYTSGAIASIAYEEKVPVLDGNVIRILTRLNAIKEDIGSPKTIQKLWALAETLLKENSQSFSAGDFNQALMELGATVCLPQNPSCLICPVISFCEGFKKNPERFPVKKKKDSFELLETSALILRNEKELLLQKQAVGDRWGGLWMFPHWKNQKSMLQETGLRDQDLLHRMTVKHSFTKYRITLKVYEHTPTSPKKAKKKFFPALRSAPSAIPQWVSIKTLKTLAFPAPHQKIVAEIFENEK